MKIANSPLSLRGLRTFCVAARHQNFRIAAEELFVTGSAVSHQIKALEEEFALSLFDRKNRTLVLTNAGQQLFASVDPLMRQLDEVTLPYRRKPSRQALRISVQPFFASELFVPQLSRFTEQHPGIDINIDTSHEGQEVHPAAVDVSIRVFRNAPANLESTAFFPLRVVPACSPELYKTIVGTIGKKTTPFPIIMNTNRNGEWKRWEESAGIEIPEPTNVIQLNSTVSVVRAAEEGLGVALVPVPASQNRFDSGQLVRLYEHEAVTQFRYFFVCEPQLANSKPVKALRNWVLQTFASTV